MYRHNSVRLSLSSLEGKRLMNQLIPDLVRAMYKSMCVKSCISVNLLWAQGEQDHTVNKYDYYKSILKSSMWIYVIQLI